MRVLSRRGAGRQDLRSLALQVVVSALVVAVAVVALLRITDVWTDSAARAVAQAVERSAVDANVSPEVLAGAPLPDAVRTRIAASITRLRATHTVSALTIWRADGTVAFAEGETDLFAGVAGSNAWTDALRGTVRSFRPNPMERTYVVLRPLSSGGTVLGVEAMALDVSGLASLSQATTQLVDGTTALLLLVLLVALLLRVAQLRRRKALLRTDPLTDLGNRLALTETVTGTADPEAPARAGTLLLLDVDDFKAVNDTLGHQVGDALLRGVARRLTDGSPAACVARLGGDEFAVWFPDLVDHAAAHHRAEEVTAWLQEQRHQVAGIDLHVAAGAGAAVSRSGEISFTELLRRADQAMYRSKALGLGPVCYTPDADQVDPTRLRLLGQLRGAIEAGQLVLHYQPKVAADTGELRGVEALVRWAHPELGLLPPRDFVPGAEATALITPLTGWVLREALRQQQAWRAGGWDLPVAVNVSPRCLHDPAFLAVVDEALTGPGVDPRRLELEITESSIAADPEGAQRVLLDVRARGVRISIDDFGSGYTSLAMLRQLPVDNLKIDRMFVVDELSRPGDRAVVAAVVDLAHQLQMTATVEGVESEAARQVAADLGVDEVQGFLVARPLPPAELAAWFAARTPVPAGPVTPR